MVRIAPTVVATAALIVVAIAAVAHLTRQFQAFTAEGLRRLRVAEDPPHVSSVVVRDAQGRRVDLWNSNADVRTWLVTYMYTRCPSICLAAGTEMQQLQAALGENDQVKLASLSFDPSHDGPEALAGYAKRFGANQRRWLVAVPEHEDLLRLLRETGVVAIDDGQGGIAHNAAILVIRSSGQFVGIFDTGEPHAALAFARSLAR